MSDLPDNLKLDLPDWSTPSPSKPLSLAEMVAICEKMLPYWNKERMQRPPPPLPDIPFEILDDD